MNKLYLGNLPYRISEADIEEHFGKFGSIANVALIKDRDTGRLKGFGFVTFESADSANNALTMDGKEFLGRTIKVSIAKDKPAGSGGGHGGQFRGGHRNDRGGDRGGHRGRSDS